MEICNSFGFSLVDYAYMQINSTSTFFLLHWFQRANKVNETACQMACFNDPKSNALWNVITTPG
uniref:Uncharacterized protein n=1 Tax=Aegilops tauschii subsp. strangulata TaxID=200361 RepID=A0A453DQU3_AEGTS